MKHPLFSVCIPTYNTGHLIREAIESVFAQTFGDYELLIQDNCSTDDTLDVIESFHDTRLSYSRNAENLGMFGNMNAVCSRAKGRYIKILCADDVLSPYCLEILNRELLTYNYQHKIISVRDTEHRNLLCIAPDFSANNVLKINRNNLFEYLSAPEGVGAGLTELCVDREFFQARGFFGEYDKSRDYSLDLLSWFDMVLKTEALMIEVPLVFQRPHPGQSRYHLPRINQLREMLEFFIGNKSQLSQLPYYEQGHIRYLDRYVVSHTWQGLQTWKRGDGLFYLKDVINLLKQYQYWRLPLPALYEKLTSRYKNRGKQRWQLT